MRSETVICIATGPSLTQSQVDVARGKGRLFICNNAFLLAPDAELLYACNGEWWDFYWPEVRALPAEKWTVNADAARRYGVNWIDEVNQPGLSTNPRVIHHGHGSGYSLVSMAYRAGAKRIVLLGYDCKYAPNYDGYAKEVGSGPRHFFGEYSASMQHWPKLEVKGGVHVGMVELYRSIARQGLVEVLNATPGSAIDCFEKVDIGAL